MCKEYNNNNVLDNHTKYLVSLYEVPCTMSTRAAEFPEPPDQYQLRKKVVHIGPTGNRTSSFSENRWATEAVNIALLGTLEVIRYCLRRLVCAATLSYLSSLNRGKLNHF